MNTELYFVVYGSYKFQLNVKIARSKLPTSFRDKTYESNDSVVVGTMTSSFFGVLFGPNSTPHKNSEVAMTNMGKAHALEFKPAYQARSQKHSRRYVHIPFRVQTYESNESVFVKTNLGKGHASDLRPL